MSKHKFNRRDFIKLASVAAGAGALAACNQATIAPTEAPQATEPPAATATQRPTATPVPPTETPPPTATAVPEGPTFCTAPEGIIVDAPDKPNGWTAKIPCPKKNDPIIPISTTFLINGRQQHKEGENPTDYVKSRFVEALTGIDYTAKWVATGGQEADTKWATDMAANDLAELMTMVSGPTLEQMVEVDALEDITDIWEATASDLNKWYHGYPDHPGWSYAKNAAGRLVGIPYCMGYPSVNGSVMWIRQDWLDQLGLKAPETLDELEATGKAFIEAGLARMGLAAGYDLAPGFYWSWLGASDAVWGAYGVIPGYWSELDGKLVHGSVHPGVKEPLALMNRWYQEGFLPTEFATLDSNNISEPVAAGEAGIIFGEFWLNEWPLNDVKAVDANAVWKFYRIPAGPGGQRGTGNGYNAGGISAFRKGTDPKKIQAAIEHQNWFFERLKNRVANNDYMAFEGYDYEWDGDKIVAGKFNTMDAAVGAEGNQVTMHTRDYPSAAILEEIRAAKPDPATYNAYEQYLFSNEINVQSMDAIAMLTKTRAEDGIWSAFYGRPSADFVAAQEVVRPLELEAYTQFITGQRPLEEFDAFVADWYAQGGQAMTDEVNKWYESMK
jgi:putative aldouronate transport system substrate-binding protein